MAERYTPILSRSYLRSVWADDFELYCDSDEEEVLHARLRQWADRDVQKETSAESAFEQLFFQEMWGYRQSGQDSDNPEKYSHFPKFPIAGGSAKGNAGEADSALGSFGPDIQPIPQVVCEYKDIKSNLDLPQRRGKDRRSPVRQALDYLSAAQKHLPAFAPIQPEWAIVTDMNEFRLYWASRGDREYMKFIIQPTDLLQGGGLLANSDDARFDRFVFSRIFSKDFLLVPGAAGRAPLATLIDKQWIREKKLEKVYYEEYRGFRKTLIRELLKHNGPETERFPGTKGRLVRLAQKILDRFIFIFFCEDMGRRISYPPQLLRDFLIEKAGSQFFDSKSYTIWEELKSLFRTMDSGGDFGAQNINQFNGGLFEFDATLDSLRLPNSVFCAPGQGANEESLSKSKTTLLYLSAAYNYATGFGTDQDTQAKKATELGLYTLGRIFEQSITELEILEAEADGRPSLNKITKRKRDGVYYTPEWVVERIVKDTLGRRLSEMKAACGWPLSIQETAEAKRKRKKSYDAYEKLLSDIRIVDPACGSGAFLITALRYLTKEWADLRFLRSADTGKHYIAPGEKTIRQILSNNIYGVDINASSVEIAKLALWLHTADGKSPLSSLNDNIKEGNSLIGSSFFESLAEPSLAERERINAFDWEDAFPEVFNSERPNGAGFDVVIGNPPYVKLQNFRKVHADMAAFLQKDRSGNVTYKSTQTGNFDLYLPFIEKGISLLNKNGRLGFIAPNVWVMNEYGEGLRDFVKDGQHLEGWIDFGAFQVFDEATIYTALQYYTKSRNDRVQVALAYDGHIPAEAWSASENTLTYQKLVFRDRWLLVTGAEREVIDTALKTSSYLDDKKNTSNIYQGLITSADDIFHLKKIGTEKYRCKPNKDRETESYEVEIEDAIMKPLVSGKDAKRYVQPRAETYILFPYDVENGKATLKTENNLRTHYSKAWHHLESWESQLRSRENGKFDSGEWYQFGRSQNIGKQEIVKLIVPRLVTRCQCSVDDSGSLFLDNVDVGGVAAAEGVSPYFLAGVINSRACGFIFRLLSKPFRGDFRSANKQFIAPLPIPAAKKAVQQDIDQRARRL